MVLTKITAKIIYVGTIYRTLPHPSNTQDLNPTAFFLLLFLPHRNSLAAIGEDSGESGEEKIACKRDERETPESSIEIMFLYQYLSLISILESQTTASA